MYKEVAEIAEADGVVDEALKNFKLAAEYYAQVVCLGFVHNARVIAAYCRHHLLFMLNIACRKSRHLQPTLCS